MSTVICIRIHDSALNPSERSKRKAESIVTGRFP
jgi:hypothetical protein